MNIRSVLNSYPKTFWSAVVSHKIASSLIAAILVFGGYYGYGKIFGASGETRYVLAAVTKGTIVASVSGTGQVSASSQVDVKPKASGEVVLVAVKQGDSVRTGQLLAKLDASVAEKSVRDAEANLESAKLSLQKLIQPADALSIMQAENNLISANQSKQKASDDLVAAYDDGFNTVANAFMDLPGLITGLNTILNGNTLNVSQNNADAYYSLIKSYKPDADQFRDITIASYQKARAVYDKNLQDYKNSSRYSDTAGIESLIEETYDTTKQMSEAIKNTKTFLDLVNDTLTSTSQNNRPPALLSTHESSLQSYTGTVNGHLGNLLNIQSSIKNNKDTITNSERTILERTESLAKLKAGADVLDIRSQELLLRQRENGLLDARENLANYYVRAPFDGVIGVMNTRKGDPASSATVIATVITSQKIAEISLNEVDVAKIKIGQKATLTFDAFADLTITGQVVEVDAIGAVSQGVVSYGVKISFDTENDQIKPGMSVSASIITDSKQDALILVNSAIKSNNGSQYVETLNPSSNMTTSTTGVVSADAPFRKAIETGLSNESITEITDGLSEGDLVVARTISSSTASQANQSGAGGFRLPGVGGR
ncbi:MAG: HlyD family efflux transporter periplasmic adaptor subunit [Candidatus Liptonbacteria bacterium]